MVEAYDSSEMQTETSDLGGAAKQQESSGVSSRPQRRNFDDYNGSYDLRDTRDEEEGDSFDDPYIYSDDSASLSDFNPIPSFSRSLFAWNALLR